MNLWIPLLLACGGPKPIAPEPEPTEVVVEEATHAWLDVPLEEVAVKNGHLAVLDTGGDGPPVLFVHGLAASSGFWQKQLTSDLAASYRLIAPDLPGWGFSSQPEGAYTPSWYADWLVGLLDALKIERAVVVGHSMGGQAALSLALDHPDRVEKLVLVAPAGVETFDETQSMLLSEFWTDARVRGQSPDDIAASFAFMFSVVDDDVKRLVQENVDLSQSDRLDGAIRARIASVKGMLAEPMLARLPKITQPTLYVYGSADALIPNRAFHPDQTPESVAEAAKAIPNLTVVRLEGAGHTPQHDDAPGFDAALAAFLGGPQE